MSGSSLMDAVLCAIKLLMLEAASREGPAVLSLGRVRLRPLQVLMTKLWVSETTSLPRGAHSHRVAQAGNPAPGLSAVPRTVSQWALQLRGAFVRLIGAEGFWGIFFSNLIV